MIYGIYIITDTQHLTYFRISINRDPQSKVATIVAFFSIHKINPDSKMKQLNVLFLWNSWKPSEMFEN